MTCGIYKLVFSNGAFYVGMSVDIERRWRGHKHSMETQTANPKVQEAYNLYGLPVLEIIETCEILALPAKEKYYIDKLHAISGGLNIRGGGTTGSGSVGELNGRSKYTNEQVEEVFSILVNTNSTEITFKQISEITGVSIQAISHIACGSTHAWLKDKYPDTYEKLFNRNSEEPGSFSSIVVVDTIDNLEYSVSTYTQLMELTGATYSNVVSLRNGRIKKIYSRWALKVPVKSPGKNIKPTYEVQNTITGEIVQVNSVYSFFNTYGLVNRPKLASFLKAGVIGSVYGDWELVSVR